jgi:hypothetical protein
MGDMTFPTAAAGIEWAINAKARRDAIAHAVEALISLLDVIDADPDLEPDADDEPDGTEGDWAFTEWHTRGSEKLCDGDHEAPMMILNGANNEDAEDDDPPEDGDVDVCAAGDHGGGVSQSCHGGMAWGSQYEDDAGHCIHYGLDQTRDRMSEPAAFADINGIDPGERFQL